MPGRMGLDGLRDRLAQAGHEVRRRVMEAMGSRGTASRDAGKPAPAPSRGPAAKKTSSTTATKSAAKTAAQTATRPKSTSSPKSTSKGGDAKKSTAGKAAAGRPSADASKRDLYEMAKDLGIEGRSKMSKQELARAIEKARG
jgi:Rho termination factor, N-terminal domain